MTVRGCRGPDLGILSRGGLGEVGVRPTLLGTNLRSDVLDPEVPVRSRGLVSGTDLINLRRVTARRVS